MTLAQILKEKKLLAIDIKKKYKLPVKNKPLWVVIINNKQILQKLYFGLATLPVDFIVVWDFWKEWKDEQCKNIYVTKELRRNILPAFDFAILDSETTDLSKYSSQAIVPIAINEWHFSSILNEFNPEKNLWNAYLYEEYNEWSIFHALIRYLENTRFPMDHKNLVKNVFEK